MSTETVAPDGGWGWMIVLGGSICHMVVGILVRSIGVYYLEFKNHFGASATATAWLPGVSLGIWNGLGPVTTSLCSRFGCRIVTITGGLLMTVGLVLTGISESLILTYFSFGLIFGVGLSFMYTPGYILVGEYFDKRKAVAFSVSTFGSAIGAFCGPPLVDYLFNFYGYFGAFLIVAGIALHAVLSGALYRSIRMQHALTRLKEKQNKLTESENCENTKAQDDANPGKKKKVFNFSLFKNWIFAVVLLMFLAMSIALATVITFLPAMALDHGIDEQRAVLLLSVLGIADGLSRIPLGYVMDLPKIRPLRSYFYATQMLIKGAAVFVMPLCADSYWVLIAACIVRGFASSVLMAQRLTFLGDLFGVEKAPSGLGLLFLAMAIGSILARLIGGLFKDYLDTYDPLFYLGGGMVVVLASVMLVILKIQSRSKKRQASMEMDVSVDENMDVAVDPVSDLPSKEHINKENNEVDSLISENVA